MKYAAKYFRANDDTWEYYHNKGVIRRQCQQTLKTEEVEELCSIPCNLNNFTSSENAQTQHTIGRFQQDTQLRFKSYYVVWKLYRPFSHSIYLPRLNRTM